MDKAEPKAARTGKTGPVEKAEPKSKDKAEPNMHLPLHNVMPQPAQMNEESLHDQCTALRKSERERKRKNPSQW